MLNLAHIMFSDSLPHCIVVDNPPFSIYAQIVRFYLSRGIDFFLFAPHLTCFVFNAACTYVITSSEITYENGATVRTSFVTSLLPQLRLTTSPRLRHLLNEAQRREPHRLLKNILPHHVVTSAHLDRIAVRDVEFSVPASECTYIRRLDALTKVGRSLFGSGLLLSERAAAERAAAERAAAERAAAERAAAERTAAERTAAERAAACTAHLSEREWAIVHSLSRLS